jgi:hypothetical protein
VLCEAFCSEFGFVLGFVLGSARFRTIPRSKVTFQSDSPKQFLKALFQGTFSKQFSGAILQNSNL